MTSDPRLDVLAHAVLGDADVDWDVEQASASGETVHVVHNLRVLASIRSLHVKSDDRGPACSPPLDWHLEPRRVPARWGHLTVREPIGSGATAVVYRAWDPRLDREVALKLIPAADPWDHAASIIEEGRLLARVQHPNVVTVFGADRVGDEVGIWMELLAGPTLESVLLDVGALTPDQAVPIGIALCAALAAVHDAGLLHRDIKAANVIRTAEGRIVLMDFGAGRELEDLDDSDLTGTPLYAAPEIFRGEPATPRSDIYSVGVLLYRLLTGRYPIDGRTVEEIKRAHETGLSTPLRERRDGLSPRLHRAVERCLAADAAARYARAAELREDLERMLPASAWPRRRWLTAAAMVAVGSAAGLWLWDRGGSGAPAAALSVPRLAVWPFTGSGAAGDHAFGAGLAHEVQRSLARLDGVISIAYSAGADLAARHDDPTEAARILRADLLLLGDISRTQSAIQVTARLWGVRQRKEIWRDTFSEPERRVQDLVGALAAALRDRLRLTLRVPLRQETDSQTFRVVLEARSFQERRYESDALAAAALFHKATTLDPGFAPAWAGLANTLAGAHRLRQGDQPAPPDARIEPAAFKAIQLDEFLADSQAALGNVHAGKYQWPGAEAAFRRAIAANPSLVTARTDYALAVLMPLGRHADALALLDQALDYAPETLDVLRVQAHFLVNVERYAEAIAVSRRVLASVPDFPFASLWLGRALALSGEWEEAVRVFGATPGAAGYLGFTYARMGRTGDALALAASRPGDHRGRLLIFCGLGDTRRALDAFEALGAGNPWRAATWIHRPEVSLIRNEPRVVAFMERLGI